MATELKPFGNFCNIDCGYCYEKLLRMAGNTRTTEKYDLDLMLEIAHQRKQPLVVFGGEALLVPIKDLERIFKESYDHYGYGSLQTNGSLIRPKHIEMFKKYNVGVGVSVDGSGEMNSLRISNQKNKTTDELTEDTLNGIKMLSEAGVSTSVIITLHKMNGTKENLPKLFEFIKWLKSIGIKNGNIHHMEVDTEDVRQYALTSEENDWAFKELAKFFDENTELRYTPFVEIESMMNGNFGNICLFNSCDPMNTQSVFGVEGNGALSNCGMVNKEGIEWNKANDENYMRDILLYQTEPEYGGCSGCPYFLMCNGYCNGSALNGDWRNKTEFCSTLKTLFGHFEEKVEKNGNTPFSKNPYRYAMEEEYIAGLLSNHRISIPQLNKLEFLDDVAIFDEEEGNQ